MLAGLHADVRTSLFAGKPTLPLHPGQRCPQGYHGRAPRIKYLLQICSVAARGGPTPTLVIWGIRVAVRRRCAVSSAWTIGPLHRLALRTEGGRRRDLLLRSHDDAPMVWHDAPRRSDGPALAQAQPSLRMMPTRRLHSAIEPPSLTLKPPEFPALLRLRCLTTELVPIRAFRVLPSPPGSALGLATMAGVRLVASDPAALHPDSRLQRPRDRLLRSTCRHFGRPPATSGPTAPRIQITVQPIEDVA